MQKNNILLSLGTFHWMKIEKAIQIASETGFDGLEILPTRVAIGEKLNPLHFNKIKSIHQNWRLDIGSDKQYGINKLSSLFFLILRIIFFPNSHSSSMFLQKISHKLHIPLTVHDISPKWTNGENQKEFEGGINYEIFDSIMTPDALKLWLMNKKHFIEIDTRDDQSIIWAKKHGFKDWKEFWKWIGLKKINGIQLTLIGRKGIKAILAHKKSLPEEQLLWLHKQNWKGNVTVEINPLSLLFSNKFDIKGGLKTIFNFADQTLRLGKNWST